MKTKVLVVDDEWSMRELLRNVLVSAGFEPVLASDEVEFREKAFEDKPDVIILDILLENKDGTTAYSELIQDGFDRDVPVIFLSALAHDRPPTFPQSGRKYALVGKPFDPEELVTELKKALAA